MTTPRRIRVRTVPDGFVWTVHVYPAGDAWAVAHDGKSAPVSFALRSPTPTQAALDHLERRGFGGLVAEELP